MSDSEEWVSVAEAARRLGLSERHVRRMMSKCPDIDRSESGLSPARVRISALIRVREKAPSISKDSGTGGHGVRRNVRHESVVSPDMESVKSPPELEPLKSELASLRAERERDGEQITFLRSELAKATDAKARAEENHQTAEAEWRLLLAKALEKKESPLIEGEVVKTGKDTLNDGQGAQGRTSRHWYAVLRPFRKPP